MATLPETDTRGTARPLLRMGLVCIALSLGMLAALPGCGGCRSETPQEKKEREAKEAEERVRREKERRKPAFVFGPLMARPISKPPDGVSEPLGTPYKPGHWTAVTLEAKANKEDFVGNLEIAATNARQKPIPLQAVPFDLTFSCQVALGKRQRPKTFESVFFVPSVAEQLFATCRLKRRKGGRGEWEIPLNLLRRMPSYQYHLVVIAAFPENYTYLGGKDFSSITPRSDSLSANPTDPYYRLTLIRADRPDPRRRLALPSYGLLWTSFACVLWDDADPGSLGPRQQQALLDWLHWGGQLIVSGPNSLNKLSDSFLTPYLPATAAAGARQFTNDDFQDLYRWSAASGKSVRQMTPPKQWTGVNLQKHADAQFLPGSGKLLVERRLGRGRIVVSAFALGSRTLKSWAGKDELFNAFLLRRPPRKFVPGQFGDWEVRWADDHPRHDAGYISNLRYFSRDLRRLPLEEGVAFGPYLPEVDGGDSGLGEASSHGSGVAAWNDFNPVADSTRTTLQNAAQIEIPGRSFVVWVLAGYLLILVPVNWAVFRLINRVEWAWAVAPVIAIACTVVVIRMAQLDIGFASSRTEIAVLELQGDYHRAHVTRYTALYTSLTTRYDFHLKSPDPARWNESPEQGDPGGLVLPFPNVDSPNRFRMRDQRPLLFSRGAETTLTGYSVQSNSTGLIHSEQMVDLGGGISLVATSGGRFTLTNQTPLTLRDVAVLRRLGKVGPGARIDVVEIASPGTLAPGAKVPLRFIRRELVPNQNSPLTKEQDDDSPLRRIGLTPDGLSLQSLVRVAADVGQLRPGQMRLLAAIDQQIPGLEIRHPPPQNKFATLVVANLKYDFGPAPQPDVNAPRTAATQSP